MKKLRLKCGVSSRGERSSTSAGQTLALPLQARDGGLLIAVPEPFLDNDALLDAVTDNVDGLLGPSQEFTSDLCEEDDDMNVIPLGRACSIMVLDVTDTALSQMSEYDPVTHDFDSCMPFDPDRPAALPVLNDVIEAIKNWLVSATAVPRVHFYSAREEQEEARVPKSAAVKKSPSPKKITNQVIMEQLAALSSQLQVLASQQEDLRKGMAGSSATHAAGVSTVAPLVSKMPSLSANLQIPAKPLSVVAKTLGPPPKTKVPDVLGAAVGGGTSQIDPPEAESSEPSMIVRAISQQSQALTALVAHLAGGDPMSDLQLGSASGSGVSLSTRGAARREKMQQELSSRKSGYFLQVQQQLFRAMHPALQVPQTEAELIGCRSYFDQLLGETRWVSSAEGTRHGHVGCCPRLRQCYDGRHARMQGVPVNPHRLHGTGSLRRKLVSVIPAISSRISPKRCVHREDSSNARHRPPIQPSSAPAVGCLCPCVHQGDGHPFEQERRIERGRKGESSTSYSKGRRCREDTKPSSSAEVPKETGVSRPQSSLEVENACVSPRSPSDDLSGAMPFVHPVGRSDCEASPVPAFVHDRSGGVGRETRRGKVNKSFVHEPVSHEPKLLTQSSWCSNLVPMVLRSRTSFSAFLSHTIQLSKVLTDDLAPTFFPVPIPPGYCHVMPARPSSCQRRACHISRVLHTIVMALNFWHAGGKFIEASSLRRAPNRLHRVLYARVRSLWSRTVLPLRFKLPRRAEDSLS